MPRKASKPGKVLEIVTLEGVSQTSGKDHKAELHLHENGKWYVYLNEDIERDKGHPERAMWRTKRDAAEQIFYKTFNIPRGYAKVTEKKVKGSTAKTIARQLWRRGERQLAQALGEAAGLVTAAGMRHLFISRRDGSVLEKTGVLHVHWVTKYPKKLGLDPASVEGLDLGNETFDAVPPEIQAQVLKSWIRITNWSRTFMCEMGERFTKKDLGLLQDFLVQQPGVVVNDRVLGKVEIFIDGDAKAAVKIRDFIAAGSPRDVGAAVAS